MLKMTFNKNTLDECVGTYKRDLRHMVKEKLKYDVEKGYLTAQDIKAGKT